MLLQARNITKAFGSLIAVNDVSLEIQAGEIVGLIGPNGAGKSTLFNCLTGDLLPTSGTVLYGTKPVTHLPPEERARLGIGRTYQIPQTFDEMTVFENVMVGAFLKHRRTNDAKRASARVVELTGLEQQADLRAGSLGTPGRKRLEIARALAIEPRLLLLDEAMAGLTPHETKEAMELVRRVHETGVTLVVVEHVMEVIMTLAHRVIVLDQGKIIASGPPRDVVIDPRVTAAYLGRRAVIAS